MSLHIFIKGAAKMLQIGFDFGTFHSPHFRDQVLCSKVLISEVASIRVQVIFHMISV